MYFVFNEVVMNGY